VGVDGFVLTGTHRHDRRTEWLRTQGHTIVTFGRPWGDETQHPWVDVDGAAGTRAATEYLLSAGHRRIAFVGWPRGSEVGDDRRAGWMSALQAAGIADTPEIALPDGVESGRTAADTLLGVADPPGAYVCASDSLGLGVLTELRVRGATGIAVGFDDTPVAEAMGMSSIRQPVAAAAAACIAQLHAALSGGSPTPQLLAPELVVRRGL
jgi:DNA-binding LacI/PurR family transcriptional regulator